MADQETAGFSDSEMPDEETSFKQTEEPEKVINYSCHGCLCSRVIFKLNLVEFKIELNSYLSFQIVADGLERLAC